MQQQYDIGKRLREVMAERGVTISQLAEMTDVSEDTIKAIRSGKTKSPGIQLMISIADALGCTMDGFLHRRSLYGRGIVSPAKIQNTQHPRQADGHANGGL